MFHILQNILESRPKKPFYDVVPCNDTIAFCNGDIMQLFLQNKPHALFCKLLEFELIKSDTIWQPSRFSIWQINWTNWNLYWQKWLKVSHRFRWRFYIEIIMHKDFKMFYKCPMVFVSNIQRVLKNYKNSQVRTHEMTMQY